MWIACWITGLREMLSNQNFLMQLRCGRRHGCEHCWKISKGEEDPKTMWSVKREPSVPVKESVLGYIAQQRTVCVLSVDALGFVTLSPPQGHALRTWFFLLPVNLGATGPHFGSYGTSFWELRDLSIYSENLYTSIIFPEGPVPDFGEKISFRRIRTQIRVFDSFSPK